MQLLLPVVGPDEPDVAVAGAALASAAPLEATSSLNRYGHCCTYWASSSLGGIVAEYGC